MAENLQLKLQKEAQEQRQKFEQEQVPLTSKIPDLPPEELEAFTRKEKLENIKGSIRDFAGDFQKQWGLETEVDRNFLGKGMDFITKDRDNEEHEAYFSLNSVAYGTETSSKSDEEKRSGTAVVLMDSLSEWYEITSKKDGMPEPAECVDRLLELSFSAQNYSIMHDKKYFFSKVGKGRAMVAKKAREMAKSCLKKMLSDKDKEEIYGNGDVDYELGESDKSIEKELKRSAKAYKNYIYQMAKKCHGQAPADMLKRKLNALRLCDHQIRMYRKRFPDENQRDPLINDMIHDYEECLSWEKVMDATQTQETKTVSYDDIIDQHLVEEGEIESFEKDKIEPVSKDEELEKEQLKGIEEIDKWLVRNFQNGGIIGTLLPFLKNPNVDFVNRVLSMSKRERLHMYYLVEKNKRKDSNILDVGLSQNYVPDLKAFKDQMVATRFKFWKRLNGDYTYIHKLSEAFQVTSQFRKEIKAVAEVEKDKKAELQTIEKGKENDAPVDAATERFKKMLLLKGALEEYSRNLNTAASADKKKKAAAEAICRESASYCEKLMQEVLELDNSVEKEKLFHREGEKKEVVAGEGASKYLMPGKLPAAGLTAVTKAGPIFGKSWNLENAGWARANLWTGSVTEAAGGVASLIGAVTSLVTLCKTGSQMSGAEAAEKSLQMIQSLVSTTQNALNINHLVQTGGAMAGTATQAPVKELMGSAFTAAGAVINTAIAISNVAALDKMQKHGEKAGEYFKKKRKNLEKEGKDKLTKEQQRELKYEKNMMKLQEDLEHRQMVKSAYSTATAGISVASIACPMLGFVNIGVAIVASIHDGIEVSKLRTKLFDNYFNMDALAEKIAKQRLKGSRKNSFHNQGDLEKERVKEDLRFRVAAYAGFSDLRTASEFICTKFARLIRSKIFSDDKENEEERNGYIDFVKAINLRYNKKKGYPDENTLVRKLSAQ